MTLRSVRVSMHRMVPGDMTLFDVPAILAEKSLGYSTYQMERRTQALAVLALVEDVGVEETNRVLGEARRMRDQIEDVKRYVWCSRNTISLGENHERT